MSDYEPALAETDQRIVIVGGPMAGKTTLARQLRDRTGYPTFCGDPRSAVRHPEAAVTYLPEMVSWSEAGAYVSQFWMTKPGPWILEGQVMARALRRRLGTAGSVPVDRILVLPDPHPGGAIRDEQRQLARSVARIWDAIAPSLSEITQVLTLPAESNWAPLDAIEELGRLARG